MLFQKFKILSVIILLALLQSLSAQNDSSEQVFFNITDKETRKAIDIGKFIL